MCRGCGRCWLGCRSPRLPTGVWSWQRTSPTGSGRTRRPVRAACSATSTAVADARRISSCPAVLLVVVALESGRTSWYQILDALRLGSADDVAEVTAAQVRRVVEDLIDMGRWKAGNRDILIVFDAGYDAHRMAYLLEGCR